jgi:hypothetical protein
MKPPPYHEYILIKIFLKPHTLTDMVGEKNSNLVATRGSRMGLEFHTELCLHRVLTMSGSNPGMPHVSGLLCI